MPALGGRFLIKYPDALGGDRGGQGTFPQGCSHEAGGPPSPPTPHLSISRPSQLLESPPIAISQLPVMASFPSRTYSSILSGVLGKSPVVLPTCMGYSPSPPHLCRHRHHGISSRHLVVHGYVLRRRTWVGTVFSHSRVMDHPSSRGASCFPLSPNEGTDRTHGSPIPRGLFSEAYFQRAFSRKPFPIFHSLLEFSTHSSGCLNYLAARSCRQSHKLTKSHTTRPTLKRDNSQYIKMPLHLAEYLFWP